MADCYIRTFDTNADPTYQKRTSDRLIGLRSKFSHTEFEFSARYRGISASATMADDCHCFRLKMIDYTKHPKRWKKQVVHLTDEQEDMIFAEACRMAGLPLFSLNTVCQFEYGEIFYGNKALKYDLIGVSFSFILPKWRIWRPHERWVFCSESVCILLKSVFDDFIPDKKCDEQSPEKLYYAWQDYSIDNWK